MDNVPSAIITIAWSSPGVKKIHAVVTKNLITYNYEEYANSNSVDPTLFYVIEQVMRHHGRRVNIDINDTTAPIKELYERNN